MKLHHLLIGILLGLLIVIFTGCAGRTTLEWGAYYPDSVGKHQVGDPRKFTGGGTSTLTGVGFAKMGGE